MRNLLLSLITHWTLQIDRSHKGIVYHTGSHHTSNLHGKKAGAPKGDYNRVTTIDSWGRGILLNLLH